MKLHTVASEPGMLIFQCPACGTCHYALVAGATRPGPRWTWNGSMDRPTFNPSIKVGGVKNPWGPDVNGQPFDSTPHICHFMVQDGIIHYCMDSTHKMAGLSVEIPEW